MMLVEPASEHLQTMMSWFSSEAALRVWAGPNFRYPFDTVTFDEDLELDRLASFCLLDDNGELLAFGQYYDRLDRCHLGRLVVSPAQRGRGIVGELIHRLCEHGREQLGTTGYSLFVLGDNRGARTAYERLGFVPTEYPEEIPLANCLYMIKSEH